MHIFLALQGCERRYHIAQILLGAPLSLDAAVMQQVLEAMLWVFPLSPPQYGVGQ